MPAATPKKAPKQTKEHAKGLENDAVLDKILAEYAEKRSQQILNDESLFSASKDASPKRDLGTKAERRARRKELQAKSGVQVAHETNAGDEQDICLRCTSTNCRLSHWLPGTYPEGQYTCQLCKNSGIAGAGVWHCADCSWDAHVSCFANKKDESFATRVPVPTPTVDADCPKPSLAWDPLSLSGPHMAIGAGAGMRNIGEVALD